jgi:hypothetical protein
MDVVFTVTEEPMCSVQFRSLLAFKQLVKVLRYNPKGRGFDSRLCNWNFSLT